MKVSVLNDLCVDLILGIDFQQQHESVTFQFRGDKPNLNICNLATLNTNPPLLFENLPENCKPIATKSRRYSETDKKFIDSEIQRMLKEGIIEPSNSPWRAQVVVTKDKRHKKRLAIDYSQTINTYTQLDAYPIPRMDDFINNLAKYKVFSTVDLKSAYHQIPIHEADKPYTAFEGSNRLYHFNRMPFGVTNGAPCFQRIIDKFIEQEELSDTFAFFDNIHICGMDQEQHDKNLEKFRKASEKNNLTYNEDKCIFSTTTLNTLGFVIENGEISPDPDRLKPLKELPIPHDGKSLKRVIGLFSHYVQWMQSFLTKLVHL